MEVGIYSDGGSDGGNVAAAACVVEFNDTKCGLVAYLGKGTNNEAEITAALLGFGYLKKLIAEGQNVTKVVWTADSEYTLKSATEYIWRWQKNGWVTSTKEPVKNQGLWRTYLTLSQGLKIEPKHVRGHTGHLQNEACDQACNWVKNIPADQINSASEQITVEGNPYVDSWLLIDGREFLINARTSASGQQLADLLATQLSQPPQVTSAPRDPYQALKTKLQTALTEAERLDPALPHRTSTVSTLAELLRALP